MDFNRHLHLEGRHAYLSASKHHWVRYSEEKLADNFLNLQATRRGTQMHDLAASLIRLGVKLPNNKTTINAYVNDAIGFKMTPEQVLSYSDNAFGTADAISFRKNKLRIHDLKTGISPVSMEQLEIYASFFCLEYGFKPYDIEIELRIYQNDEVEIYVPESDTLFHIMDRIIVFDGIINELKAETA